MFLCYEYWGATVGYTCTVGINNDGTWNDTIVSCSASAPGLTCINVTEDASWNCTDFFSTGDGTWATAKAQGVGAGHVIF